MNKSFSDKSSSAFQSLLAKMDSQSITLIVLIVGLGMFELINFASTKQALQEVIGSISIGFLEWSAIFAVAFCAIDLAGLARLITPQVGKAEPAEIWYMLGAWFLASAMNATLTWWAVYNAVIDNSSLPKSVDRNFVLNVFPAAIAILVWAIRILLIGSLSTLGDRFLHSKTGRQERPIASNVNTSRTPSQTAFPGRFERPSSKPVEPTYQHLMSSRKDED